MLSTHIIYVAFTISSCFSDVQENGEIFSCDIFFLLSVASVSSLVVSTNSTYSKMSYWVHFDYYRGANHK